MSGEEKKVRSSSKEREITGYLKPANFSFINNYARLNEMSKSKALNVVVREFFEKMPAEERQRLLNQSKNSY